MANTAGASAPSGASSTTGLWHKLKTAIVRIEREYTVVGGITLFSLFGTPIGAYIQNLSAYENKVAAQAQTDMTAATTAFADTSSTLSLPSICRNNSFSAITTP